MPALKHTIEESDTTAGRFFDYTIQLLIVISIVTFSLDTLSDITDHQKRPASLASDRTPDTLVRS